MMEPAAVPAVEPVALRCSRCGVRSAAALCPECEAHADPVAKGLRLFDVPWGTLQAFSRGDLLPLAMAPVALSALVLSIGLWLGYGWFSGFIGHWLEATLTPGALTSILIALLTAFSALGALVLFGFLFLPVLGLICLPFLDPLVARVEARLLGQRQAAAIPIGLLLREIALLLVFKIVLLLPAVLLLGVPVLGPVLLTAVLVLTMSLDFLDIIWMRRGYRFGEKITFLKTNFGAWIFYLLPLLLMVWVPLLQILILPGAAAGAVRFYLAAKK
ncbi:MAG TPA: EI24 domain-containing protein [Candidatus Obscuribacterales bacterium]